MSSGEVKELFIIVNDPPLPFFLRKCQRTRPWYIYVPHTIVGEPADMLVPKMAVWFCVDYGVYCAYI